MEYDKTSQVLSVVPAMVREQGRQGEVSTSDDRNPPHATCQLPCYPDLACPYIEFYVKAEDKDRDNKFEPKGADGQQNTDDDEIQCSESGEAIGPDNPPIPCPVLKVNELRSACLATEGGIWQENDNHYSCSGVGWDFAGVGSDLNRDGYINQLDEWHCETVTPEGLPSGTEVSCPWEGMDYE